MRLAAVACLALLILPIPSWAQATSAPTTAQNDALNEALTNGFSEVTFTQQNPLSPVEAQHRRYQLPVDPSEKYDLSKESFAVLIPPEYEPNPDQPWGLFVWISAGKSGTPSRGWMAILSKYHLIWVGPNKADNDRPIGIRFGLALDGVFNAQKKYTLDPGRIYVGGVSGGGKVASMLTMIYPEVFSGALSMAGTTFYRPVALSSDPQKMWQPTFPPPPSNMLERAKTQGRFALLTGSRDFNRDSIHDTYQFGFMQDGFKHVKYIEVPEMGHGIPEAKWVEQGIASLDEPLAAIAKDQFVRAQQLDRTGKSADALAMYASVALHGDEATSAKAKQRMVELQQKASGSPTDADSTASAATKPAAIASKPLSPDAEAASLLSLAENYERNHLYSQATQRLQKILHDYPNTPAAEKAKEAMERIKAEQR